MSRTVHKKTPRVWRGKNHCWCGRRGCWLLKSERADPNRVHVREMAGYRSSRDKSFVAVDRRDWEQRVKADSKFVWGEPPPRY